MSAAPEPLDEATGAALIGVLAVVSGTAMIGEVGPGLRDRLASRLARDGFPADRPIEEHLEELVERIRHAMGERSLEE